MPQVKDFCSRVRGHTDWVSLTAEPSDGQTPTERRLYWKTSGIWQDGGLVNLAPWLLRLVLCLRLMQMNSSGNTHTHTHTHTRKLPSVSPIRYHLLIPEHWRQMIQKCHSWSQVTKRQKSGPTHDAKQWKHTLISVLHANLSPVLLH